MAHKFGDDGFEVRVPRKFRFLELPFRREGGGGRTVSMAMTTFFGKRRKAGTYTERRLFFE